MTTVKMRYALGIAVGAALVGSLAGCAPQSGQSGGAQMRHEQAKTEVEDLYEKTMAAVGSDWGESEAEWRGCGRSDVSDQTDSWARTNWIRGALDATPAEIADRVAALWNKLGYSVTVISDDTLTPPRFVVSYPGYLSGTTPDGFGAVFMVGSDRADFSGYSRCVPSDPESDGYPS